MENEDLIRHEMEETRGKLSEKLDCLEKKLSESVEEATTAVTTAKETFHDSVESVKETVHDTMATVKETVHDTVDTVKDAVDLEKQWDRHPWLLAGGAALCGYMAATLLSSSKQRRYQEPQYLASYPPGNSRQQPRDAEAAKPKGESWISSFAPELNQLKSLALGATFGTIRELIATQVPPTVAPAIRSMVDSVTKKMGAEPMETPPPSEDSTDTVASSMATSSTAGPHFEAGADTRRRW